MSWRYHLSTLYTTSHCMHSNLAQRRRQHRCVVYAHNLLARFAQPLTYIPTYSPELPSLVYALKSINQFNQSVYLSHTYKLYHVRQKNCPVLCLQYLYQTYLYSDNFRHTYTTINLLSPVYFTFFIKSKTGNQLTFQQYSALAHCSHTVLSCFVARCRMSS